MGIGSLPGVKRPGRGVDHLLPPSAEAKERAELYLYSPSGPSWPVLGRSLSLPVTYILSSQHNYTQFVTLYNQHIWLPSAIYIHVWRLLLTVETQHTRQTFKPPAEFQAASPSSERPQTDAWHDAATWISCFPPKEQNDVRQGANTIRLQAVSNSTQLSNITLPTATTR